MPVWQPASVNVGDKAPAAFPQAFGVWTAWAPTITASTGTITTSVVNAARWTQVNKTVVLYLDVTITTNGTGAGTVQFTVPVNSHQEMYGIGRETISGGLALIFSVSGASGVIRTYANAYPAVSGSRLVGTITYEAA